MFYSVVSGSAFTPSCRGALKACHAGEHVLLRCFEECFYFAMPGSFESPSFRGALLFRHFEERSDEKSFFSNTTVKDFSLRSK
jgi:hypothetical protein